MKTKNQTFGERMREIRYGSDMMAKELSKLTGISVTEISRYENNKRIPGWRNMQLILEALNASSDDFLGFEMVER